MDYYQKKERFIERSRTVISNCDENLIAQAWDFSKQAHIDQRRKSNEPYFSHPVGVANILLSMDCDSETIAAALLHDVVEDTDIKLEEIRQKFGNDVANLVDGVTKLTPLDRPPQKIWQSEDVRRANIRKLMLSIADDPRVALIKLADRIHNLTTLGALPEDKRFRIASETLSVFAPIAEALGLENFRSRLQELAFQHLEPEIYLEIKKSIEEKGPEFDEVRRIALERIRAELERNNITAETYSRRKEIYSIYNKMLQLKSDFDEVYDIIGIRVVVNSIEDCYRVKFVIDQMGQEVKYDDYIWRPRQPLGYQSIHKVILDSGSQALIEVQIRTEEMHKQAERGSASHWIYKLGKSADSVLMERVSYLRSALESLSEALLNIEEDDTTENVIEQLNVDGLAPRIHVYSPQGDIISLPIGATPIDFAYHIHTDLGHECIGAKVNGIYVSLNHELKDGDSVSILGGRDLHLNFDGY